MRFNSATSTATRLQTTPPGATLATLAAFNLPTYSGPHWGINFNAGQEPNHYVNSDGTYLGTTP